jgi:hypothetical protein
MAIGLNRRAFDMISGARRNNKYIPVNQEANLNAKDEKQKTQAKFGAD